MKLFIAAASHGPGEHGAIVNAILLIALSAGLAWAVWAWWRKRSRKRSAGDHGSEA
jgi:hypothetical protein